MTLSIMQEFGGKYKIMQSQLGGGGGGGDAGVYSPRLSEVAFGACS